MSIYFIRHGQSVFNAIYKSGTDDPLIFDAPLSPLGCQQAVSAAEQVAALGIKRVIVSPMTRAIETALLIFKNGTPIEVHPGARELLSNSCDVGRSPVALAADFPQLAFGHLPDRWWHDGPANKHGVAREPDDVFDLRVAEFRKWLTAQSTRNIAVVGHGNFFRALIGRMLDNCEIHGFDPQ